MCFFLDKDKIHDIFTNAGYNSHRSMRERVDGKMRFRSWLTRVMAGRYGTDQLNRVLSIAALVFLVLSLFLGGSGLGSLVWVLALGCLCWSTFRSFSRNIGKRQLENRRFLQLTGRFRQASGGAKARFDQRKDYRFFRCPSCRTWLRVPRGKGKLNITCRQCGERFTRST